MTLEDVDVDDIMADEPRSRRVAGRQKGKAASALAQLAELRRTGAKHINVHEVKQEDQVYDVVEEDEYADLVAKRREAGKFCTEGYSVTAILQALQNLSRCRIWPSCYFVGSFPGS